MVIYIPYFQCRRIHQASAVLQQLTQHLVVMYLETKPMERRELLENVEGPRNLAEHPKSTTNLGCKMTNCYLKIHVSIDQI